MLLQLRDIRKSFGAGESRTEVLKGISCDIPSGCFCVLLGPSGSGKSTLLNIIGGIETPDSGHIFIGGQALGLMSEKELALYRRRHLGYVFQSYNLIPNLTVRENVEVGAYLSEHPLPVDELLQSLGLWEHRNKIPAQLSGGQQQRTSIGRALVKKPSVLLCDEPIGALDYATSKEILQLIEHVNETYRCTVVLVTHNDALRGMADEVIRLKDGAILEYVRQLTKYRAAALSW